MVQSNNLSNKSAVKHFFLDRLDGQKSKYQKLIKISFSCQQIHGGKVIKIGPKKFYQGVDGLISQSAGALVISSADCLPILMYSPQKKVIAALHAGWRGLDKDIIFNAAQALDDLAVSMADLIVAVGPHIGPCCYQVDVTLIKNFARSYHGVTSYYKYRNSNYYFDLSAIAKYQLARLGTSSDHIEDVNICTSCHPQFYSYRRDKTAQRNYSFIILNN